MYLYELKFKPILTRTEIIYIEDTQTGGCYLIFLIYYLLIYFYNKLN